MPASVSAADALRAALENPSALRVVHYCCGPFGEGPTAPPVNPICVSDLEGNVQTFMTGRATEREMLGQFFDAVRGNGWGPLVGWNFRDSNYGWPALIRRFVELGGSEPLAHPCINLRAAFDMIYEVPIAEPPLLPNLAKLNGYNTDGMLDRKGVIAAWRAGETERLLTHAQRCVRVVRHFVVAHSKGKLVTGSKSAAATEKNVMDSASDASHAPSPGAAGWQGSGEPTDASIGGMPAVVELLEHLERSHDQPDRTVEKLPSHLQNPDLLAVAENLGVIAIIERVFVPGGRGFDSFAYRVRNPKGNPRSLRTVLEESLKQAHESSKVRIQLTQRGGAFLAQRRLTPRAPKPGPLVGDAPTGATVEDCDAGPPQPHIEKMGGPRVSGTASQVLDDLVTLDQAAATVQQSKRTLERYLQEGKLPRPDFPGGGGKANKWYWSTILPSLRGHFRPDLPDKFPASRVV